MADFWKTYKPRPEGEQPPLHVAVKAQDLAGVRTILDAEAGKASYEDHRKGNTFLSEADDTGLRALHHAVKFSNLDIIKALCDIGHPVNGKITNPKSGLPKGTTALMLATHGLYENEASDGKRLDVVNLLLAAGATPDIDAVKRLLTNMGKPSSSECCQVMRALVQAGATVNKDLVTLAQQKCSEGDQYLVEIANYLAEHLAEISKPKKKEVKAGESPPAEEDAEGDEEAGEDDHGNEGNNGKGKGKSQVQMDKAELRSILEGEDPDMDKVKELVEGGVWVTGQMVRQSWYQYESTCTELESGEKDLESGDAKRKEVYEFLNENQTPGKGKDDQKGKGKNRSGDRKGKGKYDRKGEDRKGYKGDYDGKGKEWKGYKGDDNYDGRGKEWKGYKGDDNYDGKGKERKGYKGDDNYDGKGKERKGYKGDDKGKGKKGGYKGDDKGKERKGYKGDYTAEYNGKNNDYA